MCDNRPGTRAAYVKGDNILLRTNWVIRETKFGSIESGGKFPEKKESCVAFPANGRSITPRQVPINPTEINKNGSIV